MSSTQTLKGCPVKLDLGHVRRHDLRALMSRLIAKALHQLLAGDLLGEAGVVLDVGREHELAARDQAAGAEALDEERLQVGARRVDGGGEPGRAGADDDQVADVRIHS